MRKTRLMAWGMVVCLLLIGSAFYAFYINATEKAVKLKPEDLVAKVKGKVIKYKEVSYDVRRSVHWKKYQEMNEKEKQAFILQLERESLLGIIQGMIVDAAIEESDIKVTQEEMEWSFREHCKKRGLTTKEYFEKRLEKYKAAIEESIQVDKMLRKAVKYWEKHPELSAREIYEKFLASVHSGLNDVIWLSFAKHFNLSSKEGIRKWLDDDKANSHEEPKVPTIEELRARDCKSIERHIKRDRFTERVVKGITEPKKRMETYVKWLNEQIKKTKIEILLPQYKEVTENPDKYRKRRLDLFREMGLPWPPLPDTSPWPMPPDDLEPEEIEKK